VDDDDAFRFSYLIAVRLDGRGQRSVIGDLCGGKKRVEALPVQIVERNVMAVAFELRDCGLRDRGVEAVRIGMGENDGYFHGLHGGFSFPGGPSGPVANADAISRPGAAGNPPGKKHGDGLLVATILFPERLDKIFLLEERADDDPSGPEPVEEQAVQRPVGE